jgi:DNA-binding CsgD family transcriptional regulator
MLVPENCAGRPLSPRERECLKWAACGRTLKEIAMILDLSHSSVRIYLDMARRKLDAVNLTQAVAVAIASAISRAPVGRLSLSKGQPLAGRVLEPPRRIRIDHAIALLRQCDDLLGERLLAGYADCAHFAGGAQRARR